MTATPPSHRGLAEELPLVAVHLAVVAGFARVYDDTSFAPALAGFVLGAHALAIAARRARVPVPLAVAVAAGGAVVASTWILFPATTSWGLPTRESWAAASEALAAAREQFPVVVAPTSVEPGFQLAAGWALWLSVWFGDWTAHRLRATAEAVVPALAIFVFCAVLGSGDHQVASATLFAGSVVWFVVARRAASLEREQHWLPTRTATLRSLRRSAALVGIVALGAGALIGPRLPGVGSEPTVDWRGGADDRRTRVTVSPLVDLRSRLVDQSDLQVFEVRSPQAAYWRLTSLDRFDGTIWSSSGRFRDASSALGADEPPPGAFLHEVRIEALEAIWAPTAYRAIDLQETSRGLRWDDDSSTLIVESSEPTSDGMSYSVVSAPPTFDPSELRSAGADALDEIDGRYLQLPDRFPEPAAQTARAVTAGARTRYEQARRLQDWFRTEFTYSLAVGPGHGDTALLAFLDRREGYCEQFAGAYAAMARSLGLPARVAVGFTPGDPTPGDPDRYEVRGRHAHAWPEVWFPQVGWVPFEPTPGRGMPGSEAHTGVVPQQASPNGPPGATSETIPTTTEAAPPPADDGTGTPTTPPVEPEVVEGRDAPDAAAPDPAALETEADAGPSRVAVLAVLAGVVAGAALVARPRVRRRRRDAVLASLDPVERAWQRALEATRGELDLAPDPSETPREFVQRLDLHHPTVAAPLAELATLVTEARWSPTGAPTASADRAAALGSEIDDVLAPAGPDDRSGR